MARKKSTAKKSPRKQTSKAVAVIEERLPDPKLDLPVDLLKNPRNALFLQLYFDRESPTWGNMKQSAIRAGFSEMYAETLSYHKPQWFRKFVEDQDFVQLAEGHLREVLTIPNMGQAMGAFGPIFRKIPTGKFEYKKVKGKRKKVEIMLEEPVIVPNTSVIKVKNEAAKLVLPAHDPAKYRDKGPKVSFNFNYKADQDRYK